MAFAITILSGAKAGTATSYFGERLLLGSSRDCDHRLIDPGVAARHCLLGVNQEQVWIRDLKSPGGTCVNGKPLRQGVARALLATDVVGIGPVQLRVALQHESSGGSSSAIVRWLEEGGVRPATAPGVFGPSPAHEAAAVAQSVPKRQPVDSHERPVRDIVRSTVQDVRARSQAAPAPGGSFGLKPRASLVAILSAAVAQCRATEDLLTDEELCAALALVMKNVARRMKCVRPELS